MARYKNISERAQRLIDANDELVAFVAPSQTVAGDVYRQFAWPGSPIIELRDHDVKLEPIRTDLIKRSLGAIRDGLQAHWQSLRPEERKLLERAVLVDIREYQHDDLDLPGARRLRQVLRHAYIDGFLTEDEPRVVFQSMTVEPAKPVAGTDSDEALF